MINMSSGTSITVKAPDTFKEFTLTAGTVENYRLPPETQFIFLRSTAGFWIRISKEERIAGVGTGLPSFTADTVGERELGQTSIEYDIDQGTDNFVSVMAIEDTIITMSIYS